MGAFGASEEDFETCAPYAGPEKPLGNDGPWLQAIIVGKTWDLKSVPGNKHFKCLRTRSGHECTHVLMRIWPNRLEENLKLCYYNFPPPCGMDPDATESWARSMRRAFVTG